MPDSTSAADFAQCLKARYTAGMNRVREGFIQSLQIVVSGIGAYAFAQHILGHYEPIFAATAAIVSLGYVRGATHSRRMLEVTIGVTLGVFIGDMLMMALGRGLWQAGLVMLISILLARFLDNGIIFTIQMGLQSCLVVLMHPSPDGPFARSIDAIVGGSFAFLLMFIFPRDPRVAPRKNATALLRSYSKVLQHASQAMHDYNYEQAHQSLLEARKLQPLYNAAEGDLVTARGMAKLSMLGKRHSSELEIFAQTLSGIDLAIRNTRMFNRRLASTIRHVVISPSAVDSIAQTLKQLAQAVDLLADAVNTTDPAIGRSKRTEAHHKLKLVAENLDPALMGVRTLEGESLVLVLRPLVVDLLEATGLQHDDAVALLVPLGESMTEHAPRTSQIPAIKPGPVRRENAFEEAVDTAPTESPEEAPENDTLNPTDTRALNIVLRSQQREK